MHRHKMHRHRAKLTVLAVAVGLLVAACYGSAATQGDAVTISPAATPDAPATTSATLQGSLDEFTMRIFGTLPAAATQAEHQAATDAAHRFLEEYTAACMAAQGFTYLPNLTNSPTVSVIPGPLPGTREFAEQFGFGWSSNRPIPGMFTTGQSGGMDPNIELLSTMSAAEQEAWQLALMGDWETLFAEALETGILPDGSQLGCQGAAQDAWGNPGAEEFSAIQAEIDHFRNSIDNDSRISALNLEWAVCLSALGFPGRSNPLILRQEMLDEWNLINDWDALNALGAEWDWAGEPDGPPGWERNVDGVWQIIPTGDAVAAYRELEIVLALADVDCREQLNYGQRRTAIEYQLQQEFVDANRNELEAWATFAEAQRAIQ